MLKPQDGLRGLDRFVSIDYRLKKPAQKVTVEILDGQGQVIRTFTGTEEDAKARPAAAGGDEEFFGGRRTRSRAWVRGCSG